ncbi:hypothetical protein ACIPLC_35570 [Kitasatospora sp. NPDC086801]|uniref:hypothetical protein n=1 Tax=Kitasatospora sp. NPDC086801 TaxID=3364066 RepID=UPI00380555D9
MDPGFDLSGEGFSAMVSLMLLASPARGGDDDGLVTRLAVQVETCRWLGRYRFFPGAGGLPADTDCTAMATGALYEHGLLPGANLERGARELLRAAAPSAADPRLPGPGDQDGLHHRVLMVYWEDDEEPATLRRGHKRDAVACANALFTLHLANRPATGHTREVMDATTRYLTDHLTSGRYLAGTRYYPSPDAFLYAVSRLCARFPRSLQALTACVREAVGERAADAAPPVPGRTPGGALDTALRTLAADNLAITTGQDQRRTLLAQTQRPDGSWPASAYYRMGRFPVYFGSSYLTTVFAMTALRPPHTGEPRHRPHPPTSEATR